MYNFDGDTIPPMFPVLEGALLRPWFAVSLLDQGLQLIRDRRITDFHCLRNAVGALIDHEAPVVLQFEKNSILYQGFAIRNTHCSICRRASGKKACIHAAALAILSLTVSREETKAIPIPLGFAGSGWLKIGMFLYDWLNRTKISIDRTEGDQNSIWHIKMSQGSIRIAVPNNWCDLSELLLQQIHPKSALGKEKKGATLLNDQLQLVTMTEGERVLSKAGSPTIGWRRDNSLWLWLARMLYILHGDTLPVLQRDPSTSLFTLRLGEEAERGALAVELPRERTWEFVRNVPFSGNEAKILPTAKECYRVFFNTSGLLEVCPSLRLADGRVLARKDLAKDRFSTAYYLENEGFLPVSSLSAEGTFNNPALETGTMPLFGFIEKEKNRDQPFTVSANEIPAFLDANRGPLHFPENIVDQALLDLQVHELPDRLYIDSFEEHNDWCYLSCRYGLGNTKLTLEDVAAAREKKLTCLPGKEWLQIDGTPLSWLYDLAEERLADDGSGKIRLSYREMMALTAIIPDITITIQKKSLRQQLAGLLDASHWTDDLSLTEAPPHLRPYQQNGLAWLSRLHRLGIGGLLADDMGLGKTHQGLALLQAAAKVTDGKKMMVICPASVVLNWAAKIDQFYQGLDYAVYYGQQRDLPAALAHDVIITTFGIVRQDLELLRSYPFDIILIDEIQHLKNRTTAGHQAVVSLNGRVKIGLTGTPVENSLQDLRSLFDICLPGLLGSERQFDRLYVQPITNGRNNEVRQRLSRLIHPFILRRSRSQVLTELPDIIEDDRICELSFDQIGLYREVIGEREKDLERLENGSTAIPYLNILATITRLKQICCHPCLVQGCEDTDEYESGKWNLFVDLAAELMATGMKFVVFSQYTGMLTIIENYLQRVGVDYASLKGDMPVTTRQKMITDFNTNPDCRVFCASLLAGGVGIDLTAAQAVIHYDLWWNPAREEQATARVHRMGQENIVQVFRLITRGTLEEKIHRLITKKRELANSLIQEDEAGIIKQLDRKQLAELFRL